MKKVMLLLLLPLNSIAQPILEGMYPSSNSIYVNSFTGYGDKYYSFHSGTQELKLFNTNHTLWKTISIPSYGNMWLISATPLSDELINSDNLVEYSALYIDTAQNPDVYKVVIRNENNITILDVDSVSTPYPFMMADGSYKLLFNSQYNAPARVYSLPGTLPCVSCATLKTSNLQKQQPFISEPIPNPSTGVVSITYMLPPGDQSGEVQVFSTTGQQVGNYQVYNNTSQLTIPQNSLAPGNYFYHLKTSNSISETKKLVITR